MLKPQTLPRWTVEGNAIAQPDVQRMIADLVEQACEYALELTCGVRVTRGDRVVVIEVRADVVGLEERAL